MMRVLLLISLLIGASACTTQQPSMVSGPPRPTPVSRPPTENQVITFIQMINAQVGWALGKQAVLHTLDGGMHWRDVTPNELTTPVQHVQFRDATTAWIMTISQDGPPTGLQIFRTSDAGLHWHRTQGSLRSYRLGYPVQITFLDEQYGWILSTLTPASANPQAGVDVFRTVDGGKTWNHIAQPGLPGLGGFGSGLTFITPTTGWAAGHAPAGQAAYFYVTHDGGSSWELQSLPLGGYHTFGGHWGGLALQPPVFFNALEGVVLAYGLSPSQAPDMSLNALYVTHDSGTSWQLSATVPGYIASGDFLDINHAWLIDYTTLFSTTDGGQHWTLIHPQGITLDMLQSVSFVSPTLGWAVERCWTDTGYLVRTTDGGHSWRIVHYGIEA